LPFNAALIFVWFRWYEKETKCVTYLDKLAEENRALTTNAETIILWSCTSIAKYPQRMLYNALLKTVC